MDNYQINILKHINKLSSRYTNNEIKDKASKFMLDFKQNESFKDQINEYIKQIPTIDHNEFYFYCYRLSTNELFFVKQYTPTNSDNYRVYLNLLGDLVKVYDYLGCIVLKFK